MGSWRTHAKKKSIWRKLNGYVFGTNGAVIPVHYFSVWPQGILNPRGNLSQTAKNCSCFDMLASSAIATCNVAWLAMFQPSCSFRFDLCRSTSPCPVGPRKWLETKLSWFRFSRIGWAKLWAKSESCSSYLYAPETWPNNDKTNTKKCQ